MARQLLDEDLWSVIARRLPSRDGPPRPGRPPTPDRLPMTGIIFVLRTGIPWEDVPQELGCSGMTCWKRLRDWHRVGVWRAVHQELLERLQAAGVIDWSRASVDSAQTPARRRGEKTGKNPTDRAQFG